MQTTYLSSVTLPAQTCREKPPHTESISSGQSLIQTYFTVWIALESNSSSPSAPSLLGFRPSISHATAGESIWKYRPEHTLPLQASQCCPRSSASTVPTAHNPVALTSSTVRFPRIRGHGFKRCGHRHPSHGQRPEERTTDLQEGIKTWYLWPVLETLCSHRFWVWTGQVTCF